ncbi:pseudouridine synthase [Sediminispirochaeta bajacaliforniensis]|uniref:pseudouridine synthase n=1 Tax=Sediminispirochaeta bajacaliforniensis TaxID=148 RepID=UPI00035D78EC|nr:pseudouridine synthase [Sediminispirochaeta bajacaliforniensis]
MDKGDKKKGPDEAVRLQLYLARSGVGSRRACEKLISEGCVRVNGQVASSQGIKVVPGMDSVTYRGKPVFPTGKHYYIALNKPVRYLCTHYDSEGRPLAEDLIKGKFPVRLFNVGRLDFLSSGLIFFTNDGEFAKIITHPSHEIEKEYVVETAKRLSSELLEEFRKGVVVEGELYRIHAYNIISPVKVRIVLREGKNREIRKLFTSKNIKVKRLHRVRIGPVQIAGMHPGEFRNLKPKEIAWFMKQQKGEKR